MKEQKGCTTYCEKLLAGPTRLLGWWWTVHWVYCAQFSRVGELIVTANLKFVNGWHLRGVSLSMAESTSKRTKLTEAQELEQEQEQEQYQQYQPYQPHQHPHHHQQHQDQNQHADASPPQLALSVFDDLGLAVPSSMPSLVPSSLPSLVPSSMPSLVPSSLGEEPNTTAATTTTTSTLIDLGTLNPTTTDSTTDTARIRSCRLVLYCVVLM